MEPISVTESTVEIAVATHGTHQYFNSSKDMIYSGNRGMQVFLTILETDLKEVLERQIPFAVEILDTPASTVFTRVRNWIRISTYTSSINANVVILFLMFCCNLFAFIAFLMHLKFVCKMCLWLLCLC